MNKPMQTSPDQRSLPHSVLLPYDVEVLRALAGDFLLLTRPQICQLFPGRSVRSTNYRLKRLMREGYVSRRFFPTTYPAPKVPLYYLDPRGADVLGLDPRTPEILNRRRLAAHLRDTAIPHYLLVNSVHIKFLTAVRDSPDYQLTSWIPQYDPLWQMLNDYGFPLQADAYVEYRKQPYTGCAFLELDRGTERAQVINEKLKAYSDYAASGHFGQHFSAARFRVLFICTSSPRTRQLLRLATPYGPDLFWFTTLDCFLQEPLFGSHWLLPGSDTTFSLATPP